jgi:hypothetical protein
MLRTVTRVQNSSSKKFSPIFPRWFIQPRLGLPQRFQIFRRLHFLLTVVKTYTYLDGVVRPTFGRLSKCRYNRIAYYPDAIQKTTDGSDFYFFILKKDAASQLYGSFFGQQGGQFPDHVDGGTSRFDANGVIYQGVCGNCGGGTNFPTTPGAWSPINRAPASVGGCNMVAVKINLDFSGEICGAVFYQWHQI